MKNKELMFLLKFRKVTQAVVFGLICSFWYLFSTPSVAEAGPFMRKGKLVFDGNGGTCCAPHLFFSNCLRGENNCDNVIAPA
jgi:hypothetical protein